MTDYIVTIDENNKETQHVLAERLIRCKDCANYIEGKGRCDLLSLDWHPFYVKADDFCSKAERSGE